MSRTGHGHGHGHGHGNGDGTYILPPDTSLTFLTEATPHRSPQAAQTS